MEFNRNQFLLAGVLALLLGVQVRMVDSYVLSNRVSAYLLEMKGKLSAEKPAARFQLVPAMGPIARKVVQPPTWLGWALMSAGSVLVLHSFAMKRPGV